MRIRFVRLVLIWLLLHAGDYSGAVSSVHSHLLQLEQTVQGLQFEAHVQEQKYAAVLSSVLSKLTTTTDELKAVKGNQSMTKTELESLKHDYNSLVMELEDAKRIIKAQEQELNITKSYLQCLHLDLEDSKFHRNSCNKSLSVLNTELTVASADIKETTNSLSNISTEIGYIKSDVNNTKQKFRSVSTESFYLSNKVNVMKSEVDSLKTSLDNLLYLQANLSSDMLSTRNDVSEFETMVSNISSSCSTNTYRFDLLQADVGFDGSVAEANYSVQKNEVIRMDENYNKGGGYDNTTGYFTAPVSGSYIFWVYAFVTFLDPKEEVVVRIKSDDGIVAVAFGKAVADEKNHVAPVTGMTVAFISKGSSVSFTPSTEVVFKMVVSRFGGALLHPNMQ